MCSEPELAWWNGVKCNFKGRFTKNDLKCDGCNQEMDTQSHVLVCQAYGDLREGLSFKQDMDLVLYFRKVVERRQNQT